ncbi:MAG: cytochrome P450/oxidoreductase [Labilithrix sp.]|nr:cytochrome P450/oxidoreductase [Labilithrix sp.]
MQPAPESTRATIPEPVSIGRLPVIDYDTDEFREHSVQVLALACERGPLCRVLPRDIPGVLRFRDVDAVLRDPLTFSSKVNLIVLPPDVAALGTLIGEDPPDHTRLRALLGQSFTPARLDETMAPRVLAIARELVRGILDRGSELDLVRDFAVPFPVTVIAELLGVDPARRADFKRWSDEVVSGLMVPFLPEGPEKERRMAVLVQALRDLDAYLLDSIAALRARPRDNLLSFMVNASEGSERLSAGEVLSLAKLLLIAGNETTTRLIGLMMNQLLANPAAMKEVSETPGLLPNAVEEAARLEGPVFDRVRRTTRPCTVAGLSLPAGAFIDCVLGAANLDARVFADPTQFDIHRKIPRHLGFGTGIHQCLGAPLARMEMRIAFEELLEHMTDIEPTAPPVRSRVGLARGFDAMPLRYRVRRTRVPAAAKRALDEVAVADKIAARSDAELGLDKRERETVRVARVRDLAENIKMFRFVHPAGGLLTRFTAGSHIVIHMRDGDVVHRNPYSLLNCEYGNGQTYIIAVALDPAGKGGSRFMHEKVKAGMELEISVPANDFPIEARAKRHLLVAGGIGITPIFAQRLELRGRRQLCELHYTFKCAGGAALADLLEIESDPNVHFYDNSRGQRLDVTALLRAQPDPRETAVYVCGPERLMSEVIEVALRLGWPKELVRFERFGAPRHVNDAPFTVVCERSGREIVVGAKETLLEALERSGLVVPYSCRAGSCGACELTVLAGAIDHRDSVLTDEEKAEGKKILACVSRGKTRLVLAI